jgi:transcriptional regulator with XRE-family HTH domain
MANASKMTSQEILAAFGQRLRHLRKARNLRQLDMAHFGLNHKYYQRLESGQVNPTLFMMHRIAEALDVSVCDLLRTEANCQPPVSSTHAWQVTSAAAPGVTVQVTVTFPQTPLQNDPT